MLLAPLPTFIIPASLVIPLVPMQFLSMPILAAALGGATLGLLLMLWLLFVDWALEGLWSLQSFKGWRLEDWVMVVLAGPGIVAFGVAQPVLAFGLEPDAALLLLVGCLPLFLGGLGLVYGDFDDRLIAIIPLATGLAVAIPGFMGYPVTTVALVAGATLGTTTLLVLGFGPEKWM